MKRWIDRHATVGLAASAKAAVSLFGPQWHRDPRWRVLYCGIDLAPFEHQVDSMTIRAELGIPQNAFVVGHVGRFDEQKNHAFLLDIFGELASREPDAFLLLVGDGPLRSAIEDRVAREGLADRVLLAGTRGDVPQLMMGAMDLFLLPSLFEGLPLVLMETQAAGLPCVVSDVITEEATLVDPLMTRLSLSQPPSAWAERILAVRHAAPTVSQPQARCVVEQTPLNVQNSVSQLQTVYGQSTSPAHRSRRQARLAGKAWEAA